MKRRENDKIGGLRRSILATITYSDYFNFPLTRRELHTRLIGISTSQIDLIHELHQMLKSSVIGHTGNFYYLPSRRLLIRRRLKLKAVAASQIIRARSLATRLGKLPGVRAVYLTGSLAVENAPIGSDIDFMIVTENGRVWTTRLLLTAYSQLFGLRRTPHSQNNAGKLCLNLFLSPVSYALPIPRRSLYTAYELLQAVPLYDPQNTRSDLLDANSWIHDYLPNWKGTVLAPKRTLLDRRRGQRPSRDTEGGRRVLNVCARTLESLLYNLQLAYMRPKITREYITGTAAFFHPRDPSKAVFKRLEIGELYNSLKIEN